MKARLSGYGKCCCFVEVIRVFQEDGWTILLAVTTERYKEELRKTITDIIFS